MRIELIATQDEEASRTSVLHSNTRSKPVNKRGTPNTTRFRALLLGLPTCGSMSKSEYIKWWMLRCFPEVDPNGSFQPLSFSPFLGFLLERFP